MDYSSAHGSSHNSAVGESSSQADGAGSLTMGQTRGKQSTSKHYPHRYIGVAAQFVYSDGGYQIPIVARISLTDYRGNPLLDSFVRPPAGSIDYRTRQTGLVPPLLENAPSFSEVQQRVLAVISDKILVGYAIWSFLSMMGLSHSLAATRDVAVYRPILTSLRSRSVIPLPTLVQRLMVRTIGISVEHPLESARAAMDIFRSCEEQWERFIEAGLWPCLLPPAAYQSCFS